MTALAIYPGIPTFRVSTPNLGGTLIKFFNPEETKSVYLDDRRFVVGSFEELEIELLKVYFECSEENWDGYGAEPISEDVIFEALEFLKLIPEHIPKPEIVPEPEGEIGFEWDYGDDSIFVASVKGTGIVAYAGLLGSNELRVRSTDVLNAELFQLFEKFLKKIIP